MENSRYVLLLHAPLRWLNCIQAGSSRRSPTQCRTMALDVVELYVSLLSEFFLFSDMAVMSPSGTSSNPTPPLLPKDSNSLTTAFHLMKILGEIQESVNEITVMEISHDASSSLKSLLESARWKFEDILVTAWLRGQLHPHKEELSCSELNPRCQYLLSPGDMDGLDQGCLLYRLSVTDTSVSTTHYYMRLQDCRRYRPSPIVLIDNQGSQAEFHREQFHWQDHESLPGLALCLSRWNGPSSLGRGSELKFKEKRGRASERGRCCRWDQPTCIA